MSVGWILAVVGGVLVIWLNVVLTLVVIKSTAEASTKGANAARERMGRR